MGILLAQPIPGCNLFKNNLCLDYCRGAPLRMPLSGVLGLHTSTSPQCSFDRPMGGMSLLRARQHSLPRILRASRLSTSLSVAPSSSEASGPAAVNLHRWAPNGPAWASPPQRWVVFSDLHVTPRTLPVCLDVLRQVHAAAAARDAGVAFLGDLWHHRGSLPVEPLNALVRLLSTEWERPTVMLVGNHDQVTMEGLSHALTPLAAAAPHLIHVFDGPALYAGALWLPYRRDPRDLAAAIAAAEASGEPLSAVLAHVDVQGASINNAYQARDGLSPSFFPAGMPVYSGHYHKPHTVPGTAVRYVGSPYQVSRAEAGQVKALLVLDSAWQVVEEVPLDLGPRHFDLGVDTTPALQRQLEQQQQQLILGELSAEEAASFSPDDGVFWGDLAEQLPAGMRSGDRLRLTLPQDAIKAHKKALAKLDKAGIAVELVAQAPSSAAPRIAAAETLGPAQLFAAYAQMRGMPASAVRRGEELLAAAARENRAGMHQHTQSVALSFDWVEVEGYFSFREVQRYDMSDRGLVVVTGRVEGSTGVESNGAGKTALAMAPLWALTGNVDARSEVGTGRWLTNAAVVNEDAKLARVRVAGRASGVPFEVERRVVRRGKGGGLSFAWGGEDRTAAEIRLTQAAMDAALGTQLLGRVAFYGQSEITALLESRDKDFKGELGKIVDLEVWEDAKNRSRGALTAAKAAATDAGGELKVRREYLERDVAEIERLEAERAVELARRDELMARGRASAASAAGELQWARRRLATTVAQAAAWLGSHPPPALPEAGELNHTEFDDGRSQSAALHAELGAARTRLGAAQAELTAKARQLKVYRSVSTAAVCESCLQPISAHQAGETLGRLHEEHAAAAAAERAVAAEVAAVAGRLERAEVEARKERERRSRDAQAAAVERAAAVGERRQTEQGVAEGRQWLEAAGVTLAELSAELSLSFSSSSEEEEEVGKGDSLCGDGVLQQLASSLRSCAAACSSAQVAAKMSLAEVRAAARDTSPLDSEIRRCRARAVEDAAEVERLVGSLTAIDAQVADLKAVDDAFKPSGVTSYVIEASLGALQDSANRHLAVLSPDLTLELSATKPSTAKGGDGSAEIEQVSKRVLVRVPGSTELRPRSVQQLSGGERRRVALALALGFTELAARRGRLRCELLVLDEVMQYLDGEGCAALAGLLRGLDPGFGTVLVVAQANSFMTRAFDAVDVVVRGRERGSVIERGGGGGAAWK